MNYRDYNRQFKKTKKGKLVVLAIILAVVALFTTVFLAQPSSENQGYRTVSVIETSGNVSVVKEGIEYRAYPGMLLQEGYELVTTANSYVRMVLDGDKYVKLEAGSRAIFETLGFWGSGKTSIRLERGALTTEITKPLQEEDDFVINTPNAVLAVRGTFFRVDLSISEKGDVKSDIMTYGGKVASQRVLPTGQKVDEEVLIESGFKASINMTQDDTYYVVATEDGEDIIVDPVLPENPGEEVVQPTTPIFLEDISDEDLIDVYFAAENGHELFVTVEDVKADLEEREIKIEEQIPVYQKAEAIEKQQEDAGSKINKADDSQPIVKEEDKIEQRPINKPSSGEGTSSNTSKNVLTDGEHRHRNKRTTVAATCTEVGEIVVSCRDCNQVISRKEISVLAHDYASDFTVDKAATCTEAGSKSRHCSQCDAVTEVTEIAILGHEMINTSYAAPTCTKAGSTTYACVCGNTYTEEVEAFGHTIVNAGKEDAHTKCSICEATISDGTQHEYTAVVLKNAVCAENGRKRTECACGWFYDEEIPALNHDYVVITDIPTETKNGRTYQQCTKCEDIIDESPIIALNNVNFPDEKFREFLEDNYNTDGKAGLTVAEIEKITKLDLSGEGFDSEVNEDGGITDLTGVAYLTELEILNVGYNKDLLELDISTNKKLVTLYAQTTGLTKLDLTGCSSLETLDVSGCTSLTDLNISSCTALKDINISNTPLEHQHSYRESVFLPAGCDSEGTMMYTCNCGDTYTEVIPSTGHSPENGGEMDAHSVCSTCGEILSVDHQMTNTGYVAPSCTEVGKDIYACTCGYTYTNDVQELGHRESTEHSMETLDTPGHYRRYCNICNATFEEYDIPKLEALYVEDGDIYIREYGYMQNTVVGWFTYEGDYAIAQRDPSKAIECTITVESGQINLNLDGLNIEKGGLVIHPDAEVTLNGKSHNKILSAPSIINSGTLYVLGGSFQFQENTSIQGIQSMIFSSLPSEEERTYVKMDGTTFVYDLTTEDISSDGFYYAWIPDGSMIIGETTFPDEAVRNYVLNNYDGNSDGFLSHEEAEMATVLSIGEESPVTTLAGTEYLPALTEITIIDASNISDGDVDLSANTLLNRVTLKGANITNIDLSNCNSLIELNLDNTRIQTLDIRSKNTLSIVSLNNCIHLTEIDAGVGDETHALNTLSLEGCSALKTLDVSGSCILALDLTDCTEIEDLDISYSDVLSVDVTNIRSLKTFLATDYKGTELVVNDCTRLTQFDVGNATSLTKVNLFGCGTLPSIDVSTLESLEILNLSGCEGITELDTSECTNLKNLTVDLTRITTLDVTANQALNELSASRCNMLRTINAANCNLAGSVNTSSSLSLESVNISNTGATSVIVSGCPVLSSLDITGCNSIQSLNISETALTTNSVDLSQSTALEYLTMNNCTQMQWDTLIIGENGIAPQLRNLRAEELNADCLQINTSTLSTMTLDGGVGELVFTSASGLKELSLYRCDMTSLDFTNLNLTQLTMSQNSSVETITWGDCSYLKSLTVGGCTNLMSTTISGFQALQSVSFGEGGTEALTIMNCPSLTYISLSYSPSLKNLTIEGNTALYNLDMGNCTVLETLSLSGCTKLKSLNLTSADEITSLDVTGVGSIDSQFALTVSANTTTATTVQSATGWTDYMTVTEK